VKGLTAVSNATCEVLSIHCPRLLSLNVSRCLNLDGEGIRHMASAALAKGDVIPLRELRLSGLKQVTDNVMSVLGKAAPYLEVLDLSYVGSLHNTAIEAFVACSEGDELRFETVLLSSREAGRDPGDMTKYRRRVTLLRHLSLSSCTLLTDIAASHLAYSVPRLEHFEMSGIGPELNDDGLVRLFNTTPYIRKVDLEDASEITNSVIQALTPGGESSSDPAPQPGHALEHLTVSFAINITNDAFSNLIRKCTRLMVLEADSTRISGSVVKEFVRLCRQREAMDAKLVAIDCRNVGDSVMKDITSYIRPRLGWRSYDAKKLAYLDGRDKEDLDVGLDECDGKRVVLKTFYTWQIVDLVQSAREKRSKGRKGTSKATTNRAVDDLQVSTDRRWWSPGGRRMPAGANTPTLFDVDSQREGCIIM
jgi:F-box and leucine-rich repeat protein 2/20